MREPIREPTPPEGLTTRGPEPLRYTGPTPMAPAAPYGLSGLVEWAPTWGGMFVSLGVLILLSSLGIAIGSGTGATAAGVWGAISVIIGFLVGGWFTGRTLDALDSLVAAAHGILVWAVALVLTLIFAVVTTFLGISLLSSGAHLPFIANILGPLGYTATAPSAATTAATAVASSWITFIVLLLSLIGAAVGAVIGNQVRVTRTQGR